MKNTSSTTKPPAIEQVVYEAARSLGWLIPTTEDEVAATEAMELDDTDLPDVLKDPLAALDGAATRALRRGRPAPAPDFDSVEALARAAREGQGEISPEIESVMKRDRQDAETSTSKTKKE